MANEKIPAWKLRQKQLRQGETPGRTAKQNDELGSTRISYESRRRRLDMEEDNSKSSSPSSFSLDNKNKNKPAARIPAWKLREQQKPRRESDGTLSTRTMTTTARYHNGNGNGNRNSSSSNMSLCSNSTLSSNASSHVSRHSLAFRRRGPLDPSLPPAFRAAALRDSSFSGLPHDDGLSTLGGSVTSNDKFLCEDDSAADDDDDDDSDLSDCDSFASLDSDADDDDEAYSASRNQMARSLVENRPLRRSKHKSRFHSDSKGVHGIPLYIIAECSEHGGR